MKITYIGDSITAGTYRTAEEGYTSYPSKVATLLGISGVSSIYSNKALNGANSFDFRYGNPNKLGQWAGVPSDFESYVVSTAADVYVIMLGTNDASSNSDVSVYIEDYIANMRFMIESLLVIKSPLFGNPLVILVSPPPVCGSKPHDTYSNSLLNPYLNACIAMFNYYTGYPNFAYRNIYADLGGTDPNPAYYFQIDGIHLSDSGQAIIANEVADSILTSIAQVASNDCKYAPLVVDKTVSFVPVTSNRKSVITSRLVSVIANNRHPITDSAVPAGSYYYAPGPHYTGFWVRDFLFNVEFAASYIAPQDIKTSVDWILSKQIQNDVTMHPTWVSNRLNPALNGEVAYPLGTIIDHMDGDGYPYYFAGGTGNLIGDMPTMDNHFCLVTLAWHYGKAVGWSAGWASWFTSIATKLENAFKAVPYNPSNGLVTSWDDYPYTSTWGFLDCIALTGDSISCSVLAYNAASALQEMYGLISNPIKQTEWVLKAKQLKTSIQSQFITEVDPETVPSITGEGGYLPWTTSDGNGYRVGMDITGYAGWSGILTEDQLTKFARFVARQYTLDKTTGGSTATQVFTFAPFSRGMARHTFRRDETNPGSAVWPLYTSRVDAGNYGTYLNGGFWYYQMAWVASCLVQGGQMAVAQEIFNNYIDDVIAKGTLAPYERTDIIGGAPYLINDTYMLCASVINGAVRNILPAPILMVQYDTDTYDGSMIISGTATSVFEIAINGVPIPVIDSTWTTTVGLAFGINNFEFVASNESGSVLETITITRSVRYASTIMPCIIRVKCGDGSFKIGRIRLNTNLGYVRLHPKVGLQ